MNKYQRKRAILRKKGIEKERFFIRNGASKWEYVEIPERETWRQKDVVLWEEETPGMWYAVYREDLII